MWIQMQDESYNICLTVTKLLPPKTETMAWDKKKGNLIWTFTSAEEDSKAWKHHILTSIPSFDKCSLTERMGTCTSTEESVPPTLCIAFMQLQSNNVVLKKKKDHVFCRVNHLANQCCSGIIKFRICNRTRKYMELSKWTKYIVLF